MGEIWKEVLNGYYEVSSLGKVRRAKPGSNCTYVGKILKLREDKDGYLVCAPNVGHKRKDRKVHSLVALGFLGPCPLGKQVNHKDGNKQNNRPENLEYVTPKENIEHAVRNGLRNPVCGSKHWNSKLTESLVIEIRKLYGTGKYSMSTLGRKFGVSNICYIVNRKIWKHI